MEDFECPIHLGLIEDNRECPKCNNVMCYKCLVQCFKRQPNTCPICKQEIRIETCGHSIYLQRLINKVKIQCPLSCGATINFGDILDHETKHCPNYEMTCPNNGCNYKVSRQHMNAHLEECDCSIVTCCNADIGCEWKGQKKFSQHHMKEKCIFKRASSIISSLKKQNMKLFEKQSKLVKQLQLLQSQVDSSADPSLESPKLCSNQNIKITNMSIHSHYDHSNHQIRQHHEDALSSPSALHKAKSYSNDMTCISDETTNGAYQDNITSPDTHFVNSSIQQQQQQQYHHHHHHHHQSRRHYSSSSSSVTTSSRNTSSYHLLSSSPKHVSKTNFENQEGINTKKINNHHFSPIKDEHSDSEEAEFYSSSYFKTKPSKIRRMSYGSDSRKK